MLLIRLLALLLCGVGVAAHAEWFTLAGPVSGSDSDYIQLDPQSVEANGQFRALKLRVSRQKMRTSTDGVRFRSFQGTAQVNCDASTARFTSAVFYAQPHFTGDPVATMNYSDNAVRPVAFRQFEGNYAQRLIKAACAVSSQRPASPSR